MNPKICVISDKIRPKSAAPLPGAQRGTKGTVLFVPLLIIIQGAQNFWGIGIGVSQLQKQNYQFWERQ